ncbi:MAG TPA: FabA/FabZ family ACP-dehydratase [Casimicrobiaceae bacterium]|nr:FabA/FabZ family ACP-dehydratase [Casimicrobiaceae bacterium]
MVSDPCDPHFAAYSFVDRIDEFVPDTRARARYAIPSHVASFSSALVAEAVGQLAAWVAMEQIDFRGRPVAALATETRFLGDATPGDALDLGVEIQQCDDEAVAYNGHASIDGKPIIELVDCLGPMLPLAEFDSPDALRARLMLLRGEGASAGRFDGIHEIPLCIVERVPGESIRASLDVPASAPFFADHFPRRPVFPATLLLDTMMRLSLDAAREPAALGRSAYASRITHVKMRSFIAPSQRLDLNVELARKDDGTAKATLSARTDDKLVASARLELAVR